jgi:hypothetical protein
VLAMWVPRAFLSNFKSTRLAQRSRLNGQRHPVIVQSWADPSCGSAASPRQLTARRFSAPALQLRLLGPVGECFAHPPSMAALQCTGGVALPCALRYGPRPRCSIPSGQVTNSAQPQHPGCNCMNPSCIVVCPQDMGQARRCLGMHGSASTGWQLDGATAAQIGAAAGLPGGC